MRKGVVDGYVCPLCGGDLGSAGESGPEGRGGGEEEARWTGFDMEADVCVVEDGEAADESEGEAESIEGEDVERAGVERGGRGVGESVGRGSGRRRAGGGVLSARRGSVPSEGAKPVAVAAGGGRGAVRREAAFAAAESRWLVRDWVTGKYVKVGGGTAMLVGAGECTVFGSLEDANGAAIGIERLFWRAEFAKWRLHVVPIRVPPRRRMGGVDRIGIELMTNDTTMERR